MKKHVSNRIDETLNNRMILSTGPAFGQFSLLKSGTEKDLQLIPFKKIFLSSSDPNNRTIDFFHKKPVVECLEHKDREIDCLNALISSIKNAVNDPDSQPDDIIIFKYESVYISDMHLVKGAIGKLLNGFDAVMRYWKERKESPDGYYCSDAFYIKVSAAKPVFQDLPLVKWFDKGEKYSEEYFTKKIASRISNIFKIDYHHSSSKESELGFYRIGRHEEIPAWYWDKTNYDDIYQ